MRSSLIKMAIMFVILLVSAPTHAAIPSSRYFYSGNGKIDIASARSGAAFKGTYRKSDGTYNEAALKAINRVFGAKYGDPVSEISIRFVEFLSYLENKLNPGARITIYSGFRSPTYNTKLRENGKLAAKASLHQYGMAADLKIAGIPSDRVWNYVKELGFGGAGFYHGALVHVDVGPARSWDEETSGVGTDISEDNKLITIVTDKDIYLPGESIEMRFTRITAFPVGVETSFTLERSSGGGEWKKMTAFRPAVAKGLPPACRQAGASLSQCPELAEGVARNDTRMTSPPSESCVKIANFDQAAGVEWTLPKDTAPGRYRVRALFCERASEAMPSSITTPDIEVGSP